MYVYWLVRFHLEGPFISSKPGAVGCHRAEHVLEPSVPVLHELVELSAGKLKLLTIAAESPGAAELARACTELGITVSLGHQLAGPAEIADLAAAGASMVTHLGNGIPNEVRL